MNHGVADNPFAYFITLLENSGDYIFSKVLILNVHHGVVQLRLKGITHRGVSLHLELLECIQKGGIDEVYPLLILDRKSVV